MRKILFALLIALSILALVACKEEPAHEHTWDEGKVSTPSSCTSEGVKTYTCTGCGETKTEAVPASGHVLLAVEAKASTCEEQGVAAHYKCTVCNKLFSDAAGTNCSRMLQEQLK